MKPTWLLVAAGALALLSPRAATQLADLQPGRNFVAEPAFGTYWTSELDSGDADLDGDLDVALANGDEGPPQLARLYINDGTGVFTDESATRFAGFLSMQARDVDFFDAESDGDLDLFMASTSPGKLSGGKVSRFFTNLGGVQGGAVGFYSESTTTSWGALVAVPAVDQVCGGCNSGPFRDFSCDCDFADLDDDADIDLFFSSYGPSISGNHNSRIFLNDGAGVFNELWPWADPAADTKMHVLEFDLADFDGDFDIDVFLASRNSQSRVFLNNRYGPLGATAFQDITGPALLHGVLGQTGQDVYETEFGDADGDGDFDVWMDNYNGLTDRVLRNDGPIAAGFKFTQQNVWIQGDPGNDDEEADFVDYDGDGDLDVFVANFSGTNLMYQSSLAQGLDPGTQGIFHRNGKTPGLAPHPELPSNFNGGTSYDGEIADLDGDGDLDLLLANGLNQGNWLFRNVLGVPDTHAPDFAGVTAQGDKPNGFDTVIHASVRDNAPMQSHRYYEASLVYTVDGGGAQSTAMLAQGGQQYRGVIPAQTDATIEYHVEVSDLAGNTGASAPHTFVQGSVPIDPWTNLGSGLAGVAGLPVLVGTGPLTAGSAGSLVLSNAAASAPCALFVSLSSTPAPFKCGTLVPVPVALQLTLATNGSGALPLAWGAWPAGLSGASLYFQYAIADGAAVCGTSLSNAQRGDVP